MQIIDTKSFGEAIRTYRKQQKVTQSQLAAITNTSQRFISALENGSPNLQFEKVLKVAYMLGLRFETEDKKDTK